MSLPAGPPRQILLTPCLHEGCTAFFYSRLSNFFLVTYPHTVVLETLIDNVKLNFFYLSVLLNYYAGIYLQLFRNISHTVCEKTAIHSLFCLLSSLLFTTFSVTELLKHPVVPFQSKIHPKRPELAFEKNSKTPGLSTVKMDVISLGRYKRSMNLSSFLLPGLKAERCDFLVENRSGASAVQKTNF